MNIHAIFPSIRHPLANRATTRIIGDMAMEADDNGDSEVIGTVTDVWIEDGHPVALWVDSVGNDEWVIGLPDHSPAEVEHLMRRAEPVNWRWTLDSWYACPNLSARQ